MCEPAVNQDIFTRLDDLPLMLSVTDLRVLFGRDGKPRGKRQTYELVHSEGFPTVKIGANIQVPKWKLVEWIENQVGKGGEF